MKIEDLIAEQTTIPWDKIESDLQKVLAAEAKGMKVPGCHTLSDHFMEEYNVHIPYSTIYSRLKKLRRTNGNRKAASKRKS